MDQFGVITVHGEGETIYHVVDRAAPEGEQPAIVASYSTLQYTSGARSCAIYRAEVLNGRGYHGENLELGRQAGRAMAIADFKASK
jgi:hypothetical protein